MFPDLSERLIFGRPSLDMLVLDLRSLAPAVCEREGGLPVARLPATAGPGKNGPTAPPELELDGVDPFANGQADTLMVSP
mmetsp:Transcript_22114/g.39706  ORF Transcript_22114/g.39706 Transcript_22114/m.39706 type:complete len:80 (-) Transcript_22114:372-611(-)